MSNIYDNWERLVEAVLDREQLRQLAYISSREPSISGWSNPICDDQNIQLGSSSSTVNERDWPDYEDIISRSVNPVAYATKEDLYKSHCSSPILLDGGKMSRRDLRALKALVKLQALVRGHLVRKQTADMLRRMQAMLRAQARARAGRALISEYPHLSLKSSHFNYRGPATPEKLEHVNQTRSMKHEQLSMLKRNGSKSNPKVINDSDKALTGCNWTDNKMLERSSEHGSSTRSVPTDDERSYKILEVDTGKPHLMSKNRTLPHLSHLSTGLDQNSRSFSVSKDSISRQTVLSPSSEEVQSLNPLKFVQDVDETTFCTTDNSPQFYSASSMGGSSKRGPFTPTKSDGSRSRLSGYSDHPNYMSYTESSKAKARSFSAPKQRPQYERSSSTKRYSVHGYGESRPNMQKGSALQSNFTNKAYPGSGR